MLGLLSIASVLVGSGFALSSTKNPSRVEQLETLAGTFLLLGFGLLGTAIQHA